MTVQHAVHSLAVGSHFLLTFIISGKNSKNCLPRSKIEQNSVLVFSYNFNNAGSSFKLASDSACFMHAAFKPGLDVRWKCLGFQFCMSSLKSCLRGVVNQLGVYIAVKDKQLGRWIKMFSWCANSASCVCGVVAGLRTIVPSLRVVPGGLRRFRLDVRAGLNTI